VIPAVPGGCATLDTLDPGNLYHPVYTNQTLDESNVSWRAGVDWTPLEKTLLYASVSKGYKAGSFPTLAAIFSSSLLPVKQESLLAYEAGFKSRFFDNRIELDGGVFYYQYDNKQVEMRELEGVFGLLNTLVNIPKSKETGSELTLKYLPTPQLALSFRGTYLDAEVTQNYLGYNPFSTTPINLKGESFPNTPKWALGADAQYNWDLNDRYSAFVGIDGRYQTQSQGEFGAYQAIAAGYVNTPSALQPTTPAVQDGSIVMVNDAYGVVDLRAGIVSNDGHWHLQVFADNVTNTYYWNQARLAGDSVVRFAGMPRTYGSSRRRGRRQGC
jgi:iron complex outermembrane receptor protein